MISLNIKDYREDFPSVVTVGTFDDIHLGHRKLIDKVISISKSKNLRSIILTFNPHPRIILNKDADIKLLTTQNEKNKIFESYNIDYLVIQDFSKTFSKLSPIEFPAPPSPASIEIYCSPSISYEIGGAIIPVCTSLLHKISPFKES